MERINRKKKIKGDEEIISEIRRDSAARKGVEEKKCRLQTLRNEFLSIKRTLMSIGDYEISYNV
jgi:hypothetical protein